jgi:hypothetical protein
MRIIRRSKCNNSYCGAYRTDDDAIISWDQVDDLHVDSTIRNLLEIFRTNSEAFLKALNEPIIGRNSMESICPQCHQDTVTTHYFPGGPPPVIFYSLNGLRTPDNDTDETIPMKQVVQGVQYDVYSITIHTGTHIYAIVYHDGQVIKYDGLQVHYKSQKGFEKKPVVGVWLLKSSF